MAITAAKLAKAKPSITEAELVSLKSDSGYDERWLEKQLRGKPTILGLEELQIVRTQITQKHGGRLDILARDDQNQYIYTIEVMLGSLDSSHIVRAVDYWLRESKKPHADGWDVVAVIVAEEIRGSRYYDVVRFLSDKMKLVVVEMKALKVGEHLTLNCTILFDGRDLGETESTEEQPETMDQTQWIQRSSADSVDAINKMGTLLNQLAPNITLNWDNRNFVGIRIGNKSVNFVVFRPKKSFVRVVGRSLPDSEKWKKKITKEGFNVVGGTPGRSVHFRVTKAILEEKSAFLKTLFSECYGNRIANSEEE